MYVECATGKHRKRQFIFLSRTYSERAFVLPFAHLLTSTPTRKLALWRTIILSQYLCKDSAGFRRNLAI